MGSSGRVQNTFKKNHKKRVWTVWSVGKLVTEDPTLKNKATLECPSNTEKTIIMNDAIMTSSGQL